MSNLAGIHRTTGRVDLAVALDRAVADSSKRRDGPEAASYADALAALGRDQLRLEDWDEAEPTLRGCLAIRERREREGWEASDARSLLGEALLGRNKFDEAAPLLESGYEGMKRRAGMIPPQASSRPAEALDRLIRLAEARGRPDEAKAWRVEKDRITAPPVPAAASEVDKPAAEPTKPEASKP